MNSMSLESVGKAIESVLLNDRNVTLSIDKHYLNISPAFRCKNCEFAHSRGDKALTVAA